MQMLIYMSLMGGLLIAAILLLRLGASRLPRQLFVVLWDIALVRLLVPVALPAPVGLNVPWTGAEADSAAPAGLPSWAGIWMVGTAVTAVIMAALCWREWNLLRDALPVDQTGQNMLSSSGIQLRRVRLYVSDRITTPVAGGLFRPRIILPRSYRDWDERTFRFVLTHELIHIARSDVLQKILMTAAVCLHWFNPMVWVMRDRLDRDLEKSCDEKVIALLGENSRCDYAETLVELAAQRTCWPVCGNGFGRSATHERIVSMMCRRKVTAAGWIAAAGILTGSAAAFAAASPPAPETVSVAMPEAEVVYDINMDAGQVFRDGEYIASFAPMSGNVSYSQVFATASGTDPDKVQITIVPGQPAASAGSAD